MNSSGQLFPTGEPQPTSGLLQQYNSMRKKGFEDLVRFDDDELDWLRRIHDRHLDYFREERRMHFAAFSLVAVAFLILIGPTLTMEQYFIPFAAAEGLLLMLLVPYVFVYRKYEEGVRKAMRQAVILENEGQLRRERT